MTASGSGAPSRETLADDAPRRGIGWQIFAILAIGLIVRLIMAYGLPPLAGSGFANDLLSFRGWASDLASHGPWGFYDRPGFHDYTPGYLYALWLVGWVGQLLGGIGDLIKIPAILGDLAIGWLVYVMARDLGVTERRATIAAAVAVFNPISWFDSVVWGQVDSFGVVFLLLAIRELWKGRTERSAILAVVAALIKPQLGILAPIVAAVTIRRALWPQGSHGDEAEPEGSGLAWERDTKGWIRILTTCAAGFLTAVAMSAPFGLSLPGLIDQIFKTAAGYPYATVNAYNIWALFDAGGGSLASTSGWIRDVPPVAPATDVFASILGVPAVFIGSALLVAVIVAVAVLVARRPDRLTILVGVSVLALAFFAVPTRVHERYLYPLFALAAILVAFSWRWRIAYALASVAIFLNMYVVLTTLYPGNPSISDWLGIGGGIRSFWGVALIAVVNTGVLAWGLAQLRRGAAQTLAAELAAEPEDHGWADDEALALAGAPPPPVARGAVGVPGAPGAPAGPAAQAAGSRSAPDPAASGPARRSSLVPAWFDRPSWSDLGPIGGLRARIREIPIRPDRSAELRNERGGRLDRLDLWVVIVMVVAAMFLRTYRLAEPARMHFDEVYHARTATEFLQDWRYGISHNIYEWTHPHLAKYAMAAGIVAFAGHDVAAASNLGVPVRDAAIEPQRPDAGSETVRDGDRVWVATGTELIAYDLQSRAVEARWPLPGASAVAFDATGNQVFVGTDAGKLLVVDTTSLDLARQGQGAAADPVAVGTLAAPPVQLVAWDQGKRVAARFADGTVAVVDASTGETVARVKLAGAADIAAMGDSDALVATPADVKDPAAVAKALAAITGGDATAYEAAITKATGVETVVLDVTLTADLRTRIDKATTDGLLAGITYGKVPLLAVADGAGLDMVTDAGIVSDHTALTGGSKGLALVTGLTSGNQLYATTVDPVTNDPQVTILATSGDQAKTGPQVTGTMQMPGTVTRVLFDESAQMVEVLGVAPDGGGPTIYVIEPHGNAVFADHRLPFQPVAWVMDHNSQYPSSSRGQILAFGTSGETAAVDIGHYDFSWRLPGVILGALTVGVLYLLTRLLFRRRTVAVLAGLFMLLDGMAFVQSRIAMNDVYTGFFMLAAYLVFAWLWLNPGRSRRAFWLLMPVVGLLLGLALASKWTAAYAIGALGILVLARSALGRLLLIAGLLGLTGVLGWMALAVPTGSTESGNPLFPMIMIALTLAAVAITVYRPIAWSNDEVLFAVGAPAGIGILIALAAIGLGKVDAAIAVGPLKLTPLPVAFLLIVLGGVVYLAFNVAGRMGLGPMASPVRPDGTPRLPADSPPDGWLRLGDGLGLSAVWIAACLLAIPLAVYVISYLPWAAIEGHQIVGGWPPGHTGQTLVELTGDMYRYHNNLTAAHPASSPWWAWPLNLKPVWFYQGGFANNTAAAIYDAGNMVVWWLGIPAMAFTALQAYRRRSLALAMILVGFLAQWISWARIDRAAFEYHYYTSLPFIVMGLAYLVAEIWHGASRRTWLAVRIAGAVAVMGPALMWLMRAPLCRIANVEAVNKGSQACNGNPGNLVVTPSVAAMVVIGLVLLILIVRQLLDLGRPRADGSQVELRDLAPLVLTAVGGGAALALTRVLSSSDPLFSVPGFVPEVIALIALVPLAFVAFQVVTARDGRRFVAGVIAATAAWFVVLYPNISALPLPTDLVNAYQGLLPTYLYPFQFAVNTVDRSGSISFSDPRFAILMAFLVVAAGVVAYSAWTWRQAAAEGATGGEGDGEPDEGTPGAA